MGILILKNKDEMKYAKECIALARAQSTEKELRFMDDVSLFRKGSLIMEDMKRMEEYMKELESRETRAFLAAEEAAKKLMEERAAKDRERINKLKDELNAKKEQSAKDRARQEARKKGIELAEKDIRWMKKGITSTTEVLDKVNGLPVNSIKDDAVRAAYKEVIERKLKISFLSI